MRRVGVPPDRVGRPGPREPPARPGGTNNALWGFRATLDVSNGKVIYPAGAGAAAASLLVSSGLQIMGQTNFFLQTTTTLSTTNTALSAANLDTGLGVTSECALFGGVTTATSGPKLEWPTGLR